VHGRTGQSRLDRGFERSQGCFQALSLERLASFRKESRAFIRACERAPAKDEK
jgi:hypothetical protein